MGAPLWTQEEKDCFVNFIIPKSQFSSGQYDSTTGLTWKELAPLMEAEMTRRGGYPELRIYTENALSQLYYNRFSARAVSRGQSDMALMRASPRPSQPLSRSSMASGSRDIRAPPAVHKLTHAEAAAANFQAYDMGRERRHEGHYISRFTQTDPRAFLGLGPEETLSVHADPIGHYIHELTSRGFGNRSGQDREEVYRPAHEIRPDQRLIEGLGGRKRGFQDCEGDESGEFMENSASHRQADTEWTRRNYTSSSKRRNTLPSNTFTYGDDELSDLRDSVPVTRSSFNMKMQRKHQKTKSDFTLDDLDSLDESDEDMVSLLHGPKSARPNKAVDNDGDGYSKVQSRWKDLENNGQRKRQKFDANEVKQPVNRFGLDALDDDSSDEDLEFYGKGPLHPRQETDGYSVGDDTRPIDNNALRKTTGMIVDGIYRPSQSHGFGITALDSSHYSPTAKSSSAAKKASGDTSAKSKAPRGSITTGTRKEEQKAANPSPIKASAVKKFKKVPSKMKNKLPQATSKHPIEYTNRQVPFFESVNLPKIPKRSAVSKAAIEEESGRDQGGSFGRQNVGDGDVKGYGGGSYAVGGPVNLPGRHFENGPAGGDREVTKVFSSNAYKAKVNADDAKRNPETNKDSIKSQSAIKTLSAVIADAASFTPSAARAPATKKSSVPKFDGCMTEKFATLESIVARATTETKPEDAAPWAKAIAAQRGFRESVSPVEDGAGGKDSGVGGHGKETEKTGSLNKE
ncbi:hypothetical protein BKA64DRAFT_633837 [Cadophora sp. MPI-SDFR-AT-0126]|nr:hypothetical protein BKA64DRAFT_633837 [Leotiomycetes sp. MPI-SDFR-AT-0126]